MRICFVRRSVASILTCLKNSLIIHEENTKKNHKRVVSVQGVPKKSDTIEIILLL